MKDEKINTQYIFEIKIAQRYADAFRAIYETIGTCGIVLSTDYKSGKIAGKWNPVMRGELGAKINVWTGQFIITDNNTQSIVTLILSGGSDSFSAKVMAKYFIKRLKKSATVVSCSKPIVHGDGGCLKQIQNTFGQRSMLDQINDVIDFAVAILPEEKPMIKDKKPDPWSVNEDASYYPEEDHEGHDHEEDGYCIEADEYIQDMM